MLKFIPVAALAVVVLATLLRGASVRLSSGDRIWAFTEAAGLQRVAGLVFAGSILVTAAGAIAFAAIDVFKPAAALAGSVLTLVGSLIVIAAQVQMGRAWRVGVRQGDAPLFIHHGLFRFSRNPIFVGMILMCLGIAVATGWWWTWAAAFLFAVASRVQIAIEERHLMDSFGAPYQAFRETVPRWIGVRG